MAALQGLPPLPKSLQGLLNAGSAQWKETEKILSLRTKIQKDMVYSHGRVYSPSLDRKTKSPVPSFKGRNGSGPMNLDAAIAYLRREMVSVRQLDMSLLCQLWSLNESIQEYKNIMQDRFYSISETNSECSSYSLENGLDSIEDHDYVNVHYAAASIEEENEEDLEYEDLDYRLNKEVHVSIPPPPQFANDSLQEINTIPNGHYETGSLKTDEQGSFRYKRSAEAYHQNNPQTSTPSLNGKNVNVTPKLSRSVSTSSSRNMSARKSLGPPPPPPPVGGRSDQDSLEDSGYMHKWSSSSRSSLPTSFESAC